MNPNQNSEMIKAAIDMDQSLRKMIAEYYMVLKQMENPSKAVNFLAEHVAIMVEMINEFKGDYRG